MSSGKDFIVSNSYSRFIKLLADAIKNKLIAATDSPGFLTTKRPILLQIELLLTFSSPTLGTFGQNDLRPNNVNKAGTSVTDASIIIAMVVANGAAKLR